MCKLVPVLRVIGFVFLVLAIVACVVGFLAPFWIRLPLDGDGDGDKTSDGPAAVGEVKGVADPGGALATPGGETEPTTTVASSGLGLPDVSATLSGLLKNGSYEGLWAKCFHNFTCSCFWQDNFAMEKAFPGIPIECSA